MFLNDVKIYFLFIESVSTRNLRKNFYDVEKHYNFSSNYLIERAKRNWPEIFLIQEALIKRLGPNAHAFTIEIPSIAPPSVQLVPAKEYNGPPIGNSYDVRVYVGEWKKLADFLELYFLDPNECMHFEWKTTARHNSKQGVITNVRERSRNFIYKRRECILHLSNTHITQE